MPDYWIVDADAEVFEVWAQHDERPAVVDDRLTWHPERADSAFELDVRAFFRLSRRRRALGLTLRPARELELRYRPRPSRARGSSNECTTTLTTNSSSASSSRNEAELPEESEQDS